MKQINGFDRGWTVDIRIPHYVQSAFCNCSFCLSQFVFQQSGRSLFREYGFCELIVQRFEILIGNGYTLFDMISNI